MRHDNTERLGVIETDLIVTKKLGWIFREQPIIDVGLDAIIEQSKDGDPTGKFLAVQIKSGKGNFLISDNKLTYYVSHIHYHYWLNLAIPIILAAHLPEIECTYWQLMSERNFQKTKKKWKIEIPLNQEFNEKAKNKLEQILYSSTTKNIVFELYKGKIESDTIFDYVENSECIFDAVNTILKIADGITELKGKTDEFNVKLRKFVDSGLSDKDEQVKASIKGFGKNLNITSKRLENEIELFSQLYSEGFFAFEQMVLIYYLITKDLQNLEEPFQALRKIPESIDIALEGISSMRSGVSNLPKKYAILKDSRNLLLDVIDMLILEFNESKVMAENIIAKVDELE